MSNKELLEEISEIAFDPGLKATAIRDRIQDILSETESDDEVEYLDEGEED